MLRAAIKISCYLFAISLPAQPFSGVVKTQQLLQRIDHPDTLYIVNFWATWCKPCVKELPSFDSLNNAVKGQKIKVLLVTLDFAENLNSKVLPFLKRKNIITECVLLDEVNGNDFIDRFDKKWSGAIPATYFYQKGKRKELFEKEFTLSSLQKIIR